MTEECKICFKRLYKNSKLKCACCLSNYHFGCFTNNDKNVFLSTLLWLCSECNVFPFSNLSNLEIQDLYSNPRSHSNKVKCFGCKGKIRKNTRYKNCSQCANLFHIKCSIINTSSWTCSQCLFFELPFHKSTNEDLFSALSGLNKSNSDFLNNFPSFNI